MAANIMKYPRVKSEYAIMSGTPDSATIFKAKTVNPATGEEVPVGIKILRDMNRILDVYTLATQLHEAETLDHENIVKVHCSFKNEDELWIIMTPPGLCLQSMIGKRGLPENAAGCILKETLKALHYMHAKKKLHGNIGSHCIFLDQKSRLKLGHTSIIYEDHHRSDKLLVSLEIMNHYGLMAYEKATDVWMFGLLALELLYGFQYCRDLASDFEEFRVFVGNIGEESGPAGKLGFMSCFHGQKKKKKKISKVLREVMAACLLKDPKKRPTTNQLVEHNFFRKTFTYK